MFRSALILFALAGPAGPVLAQDFKLGGPKRDFLDVVAPIITPEEREIYESLPDFDARRYFSSIFWYKRDLDPDTNENSFRKDYRLRQRLAITRFEEGDTPGDRSARGFAFQLLGEPDDVKQRTLAASGSRPGFEETWIYSKYELELVFIYDGFNPQYRLQNEAQVQRRYAQIRNAQILDRAEPYVRLTKPLTLPNVGITKDVENLVAEDVHEMSYTVSYSFFEGDLNRTEVLVGLTFDDASARGVDIQLSAFDPYRNKAQEIKKLLVPENGKPITFTMPLEPDQYELVMRMVDKDGRQDISRRRLDVPRLGIGEQSASSMLFADRLDPIPLFGFDKSKKFAFGPVYFPFRNDFRGFTGERLYIMQSFYNMEETPNVRYYLDHKEVEAQVEQSKVSGNVVRAVISIPLSGVRGGQRNIKAVYNDADGNLRSQSQILDLGGAGGLNLIAEAQEDDTIRMTSPAGETSAALTAVAVDPGGLTVKRMYVFLNDVLILEDDSAPWSVTVDEGLYSISGNNTVTVVLDTDQGWRKKTRTLEPVRIKERISTRVVQIYFNAFNEDLEFVSDINLDELNVTVDGSAIQPLKVERVDSPITFCFMVDISFSMKDSFNQNIAALKMFIASMRPSDRGYFVIFHNDYVQFLEPTSSKAVLIAVAESLELQRPNPKFADRLYKENETYLYDASISAIHSMEQYAGRNVILMVSDGIGVEGLYSRNAMLNYARQNDIVIYSLWLDNNPGLTDDDKKFLEKEMSGGEKFARKIGLSRFFSKKDARTTGIRRKVMSSAINEGLLKILSEESGGFHYQVFKTDRPAVQQYVRDIEAAVNNQFVMSLPLPVTSKDQEVVILAQDEGIRIRNKSKVKVTTNPLLEQQ